MSQLAGVKCLDKYGFPLAGLTAAEQAVRTEAAARETRLQDRWSRQVLLQQLCCTITFCLHTQHFIASCFDPAHVMIV